ncbi:unnamed protein product, partial [Nesidiocoris tenuis]
QGCSQNIQESSEKFKNVQESLRKFKTVRGRSRMFEGVQGCSRKFKNVRGNAWFMQEFRLFTSAARERRKLNKPRYPRRNGKTVVYHFDRCELVRQTICNPQGQRGSFKVTRMREVASAVWRRSCRSAASKLSPDPSTPRTITNWARSSSSPNCRRHFRSKPRSECAKSNASAAIGLVRFANRMLCTTRCLLLDRKVEHSG